PFTSPDSPLEEARQEWMVARGMDVFNEYTLPMAVIRFRQGFGRLIRARTFFGAVAILDPRIRTKRYGALFLRSIPTCQRVESLEGLQAFFKSHKWGSVPEARLREKCAVSRLARQLGCLNMICSVPEKTCERMPAGGFSSLKSTQVEKRPGHEKPC
ncbi:MAG TPA: helicase C-terminal domain-containing protein, partial [Elusimicrobiota bacterium]|nr:helicase C-terminal domain-containing protein [Elusimicrobiota bacterium]